MVAALWEGMLKLTNAVRAAILNASDAVNEHDSALGYAIREAVSGRRDPIDHAVICDADAVRTLLGRAMGRAEHTDNLIANALAAIA